MIYLKKIILLSEDEEAGHFNRFRPTYYTSIYPFKIFPAKGLRSVDFSDITIFCGSNGSGKSTLLNIIAEKLKLKREADFNRTELYEEYVEDTEIHIDVANQFKDGNAYARSRIITSDDVFNHVLDVRRRNAEIDVKREVLLQQRSELFDDNNMPRHIDFSNTKSVDAYKRFHDYTRLSLSNTVRRYGIPTERTYSNGENGYRYFTGAIQPGGLYLLDEPENSLSVVLQVELADYIMGMARFYDCQFIISTHSPFFLAMPYAKIYDLDCYPVQVRKWTEIPSVRAYHDFFKEHEDEFV